MRKIPSREGRVDTYLYYIRHKVCMCKSAKSSTDNTICFICSFVVDKKKKLNFIKLFASLRVNKYHALRFSDRLKLYFQITSAAICESNAFFHCMSIICYGD